ncbi:MAG: hypothetical protein WD607_02820 [Candidatus Paceibacterota bacterium]
MVHIAGSSIYLEMSRALLDTDIEIKKDKHLENNDDFRGKFLIWLPYDEYGGIGDIDPETRMFVKSVNRMNNYSTYQAETSTPNSPRTRSTQAKNTKNTGVQDSDLAFFLCP